MEIQELEDALMIGRKLTVTITFADDEGNPVVDWSITENGKFVSGLNSSSVEEALEEISKAIGRKND